MTTNRIIELLGEIRAEYNCFDENEREKYEALSEAIRKIKPREYTKNLEGLKEKTDDN